jgi:hypothetical protein
MRTNFGRWGGHIELFDLYEGWRHDRLQCVEAGINPRTRQPFEGALLEAFNAGNLALIEASPDAKADFAAFLWQPVQANFYRGYQYVEAQWDRYLGVESVNSFDEVRIQGVNNLTGIGYVGELGQYPGMRRTIRPEAAIVIDTYGGVYSMTRKLLRSNGAQRLTGDIPEQLGRAFADFVVRTFIAMVIANPNAPDGTAMYHTSRGNTTTATLSEDSIVDAAVWLRTRTDPDGRPIRTDVRSVVVQNDRPALRIRQAINSQLVQWQTVGGTTLADDRMGRGNLNALNDAGLIPADGVIVDPYLPDANDVYYFADPNTNPAFIAAFLDGQRQPMLGMADATVMHLANSNGNGHDPYSYEGDTVDYKGRHDFGITALEPLATYRQTPP